MTPTPQPSQIPSQATNASISTPSYSSAAKKAVSSPPVAAGSSSQSSIVAVGGPGSVQPTHGKSSPILPINGKHSISPAVPVVSAPVIAYSSSITNGAPNHNRKSSVTIVANGRHSMNGGPVGGSSGKIQFGSITDSPASSQTAPQIYQPTGPAPGSIANPRVSDPSHSPTPIPQPSASGGRPQVVGPGNGVNFGSFGGDSDRHNRQVSGHQPPQMPGVQHIRHDSTQSGQSDLSNHQGRGAYSHQGGRGRGGFQNHYQQHQIGNFPQMNNSFRNTQNQGRGSIPPYQSQGRQPYSSSPHQASRSPALPTSLPGTPNMNPSMPIPNQQQYSNHFFTPHIPGAQYAYPPQFDTRALPIPTTAYLYPHMPNMPNMTYISAPPQSPQTAFQQTHYTPGQYAPQAQQMSRNSSQISDQQQTPNMVQPRTPSLTSMVIPLTPKPTTSNAVPFKRPTRKSAAIVIKRPDGEALDVGSFKTPSSPAPNTRARTPPIIASNITLPPKPSTPLQNSHGSGSPGIKTLAQIKQEIKEKVMKAAAEDHPNIVKIVDSSQDSVSKIEEKGDKIINDINETKQSDETKNTPSNNANNNVEEIDDLERQIAEIEAAELERAKKEAEIVKKRDAQRELEKIEKEKLRESLRREQDQRLREQEKEMERLEDEKEKKRAQLEQKNSSTDLPKSVKDLLKETSKKEESLPTGAQNIQIPKLMTPKLGVDASASLISGEVMGPPPRVNSAEKRINKPVALNLAPINGKPTEPPQPSAALRSLKSARFLTVLDPMIYPPSIASPNPALNQAVKDKGRSFKYDKEFLLQFQKVFIEKPSMEFESQIKALIGEPDTVSTRSGSTRTLDNMNTRSNSNRNSTQGGFNGAFGTFGKTITSGASSEQRYSIAGLPITRNSNNMANLVRSRNSGFSAGNPISRNPSNSGVPQSPRQQSRRGNASNKGYNSSNAKQEAQTAKTMPLTAGIDVRPIQVSATGWKPRSIGTSQSGPVPGASDHMDPDMVQRKVKAALNKMTPEKFDKIADQIFAIASQSKDEADGRTLRQVIQLTFEKATDEAHWASMYAKFCKRMLETMSPEIKDETILDKNGEVVSGGNLFRKYLLNRCQEEFERGWKIDLPEKPEGQRGEEKTEEAALLSDEYYIAAAAKRRGLGLVQFIGELYKLGMLTERIMHQCVKKLVDYTGVPDEAEVESLTKLLKTIGSNLDDSDKGKQFMDAYFDRIGNMIKTPNLPSRLRFMLMDIVDLRRAKWASKELNKGPKTLDEVRIEAEAAAAQKAIESARNSQRGGGGGGGGNRMSMGRGDSRSFSNQYGNPPMSDTQRNLVAMDELKKLSSKSNNSRSSNSNMNFGPSSMFSRTSSGRKLGTSGLSNRLGDDSGVSSRSGTPPHIKEKESTTSSNTYSLLAGLTSNDSENPASPPSKTASPALPKATPSSTEKSDK